MITINDIPTYAKEFAWDGCHKTYLINSEEDRNKLLEYGYTLFPIEELKECFDSSCSLRFISNGNLEFSPVEQFAKEPIIKEI